MQQPTDMTQQDSLVMSGRTWCVWLLLRTEPTPFIFGQTAVNSLKLRIQNGTEVKHWWNETGPAARTLNRSLFVLVRVGWCGSCHSNSGANNNGTYWSWFIMISKAEELWVQTAGCEHFPSHFRNWKHSDTFNSLRSQTDPSAAPSSSREVGWWSAFTSKWNVSVSRGLRSVPVREQEITTSVAPLLSLAHSNSNLLYWHDSNYAQYFQIQFVQGPHCGSTDRESKILIKETPTQPWIIQQLHVVCHVQMFAAAPAEVWNRNCSVIWSVSVTRKQTERLHSDIWITAGHTWHLLHPPPLCRRCSKVTLFSAVKQIFLLKSAAHRLNQMSPQPSCSLYDVNSFYISDDRWRLAVSLWDVWFDREHVDRHKVYETNNCKESPAADGLTCSGAFYWSEMTCSCPFFCRNTPGFSSLLQFKCDAIHHHLRATVVKNSLQTPAASSVQTSRRDMRQICLNKTRTF